MDHKPISGSFSPEGLRLLVQTTIYGAWTQNHGLQSLFGIVAIALGTLEVQAETGILGAGRYPMYIQR